MAQSNERDTGGTRDPEEKNDEDAEKISTATFEGERIVKGPLARDDDRS